MAVAAIFAAIVVVASYFARLLTRSGAIAAFFVGAAIFWAGGLSYAAVLFAFFLPASLVSRIGGHKKLALEEYNKRGPRDALQVLANGLAAAICAILSVRSPVFALAFAGAFAAACADTFGTELGSLAKGRPRSILSLRKVPAGTSGGVSAAGTLAEILGALLVALVASSLPATSWWIVLIAGLCGAFADSIAGALLPETRISNDGVNLLCTATGAAVAATLVLLAR